MRRVSRSTPLEARWSAAAAWSWDAGRVVVVAQGTIDNRDPEKLFVPALTALQGSRHLVVVITGGRHRDELRRRFPADNVVVEDFVDYGALMPVTSLFRAS